MPVILNPGFCRGDILGTSTPSMSHRPLTRIPHTNGGPVLLGSALRTHQHRGELLPQGSGRQKKKAVVAKYISFVNG